METCLLCCIEFELIWGDMQLQQIFEIFENGTWDCTAVNISWIRDLCAVGLFWD